MREGLARVWEPQKCLTVCPPTVTMSDRINFMSKKTYFDRSENDSFGSYSIHTSGNPLKCQQCLREKQLKSHRHFSECTCWRLHAVKSIMASKHKYKWLSIRGLAERVWVAQHPLVAPPRSPATKRHP